jgi:hypothetical protein
VFLFTATQFHEDRPPNVVQGVRLKERKRRHDSGCDRPHGQGNPGNDNTRNQSFGPDARVTPPDITTIVIHKHNRDDGRNGPSGKRFRESPES